MLRTSSFLALVLGGALFGVSSAWAGGWGDYATAFPAFPCQDGWMGCVVDGEIVSPELTKSPKGIPQPANLRVSWDTLEPTAVFSPFGGLSKYSGQLQVAAAEPEPEPEPVVADGGTEEPAPTGDGGATTASNDGGSTTAASSGGTADGGATRSSDGNGASRPETTASTTGSTRPTDGGTTAATRPTETTTTPTTTSSSVRPTDGSTTSAVRPTTTTAPTTTSSSVRPTDGSATSAVRPTTTTASTATTGGTADAGAKTTGSIQVKEAAPAAAVAVVDNSCDVLSKLEPQAMLGKLSDGQVTCLEGSFASAPKQTDKDKISRILMANAYSKGDTRGWEKLIKRHLEEIDQSDPDLCYKYALHLSKGGAARAAGTIRWANVALENRTVWTGDTYTTRVSGLYKLRAAAAQSLWKAAEDAHAAAPTDDTKKKVEDTRSTTKVYSREWYEYCKSAGKDTTTALQLCVSAAGTADYCEGG